MSVATKSKPASIQPDALYSFASLRALGIGTAALRELRKQGMDCRYHGRTGWVLGETLIKHILEHGTPTKPGSDCLKGSDRA